MDLLSHVGNDKSIEHEAVKESRLKRSLSLALKKARFLKKVPKYVQPQDLQSQGDHRVALSS